VQTHLLTQPRQLPLLILLLLVHQCQQQVLLLVEDQFVVRLIAGQRVVIEVHAIPERGGGQPAARWLLLHTRCRGPRCCRRRPRRRHPQWQARRPWRVWRVARVLQLRRVLLPAHAWRHQHPQRVLLGSPPTGSVHAQSTGKV
jgi:hypothetical protein